MYSPGTEKVAVVVVRPSARSTGGRGFSNVTAPGPRNTLHVTTGRRGSTLGPPRPRASAASRAASAALVSCAVATLSLAGSSVTQAVSGNGRESSAAKLAAIPEGGPVNAGPFAWNRMTGGVFFDATS